jgi:hypothetical protein
MQHLDWPSCTADPDVWLKPDVRPLDGHKYHAYCLSYHVNDTLIVHNDEVQSLNEIDHFFKTKDCSIGDPEFHCGVKLRGTTLPNGVHAWSMPSSKYIRVAVATVRDYYRRNYPSYQWARRTSGPFPINNAPELDTTPELSTGRTRRDVLPIESRRLTLDC